MNILGLITARGGSKGILRKNLVEFRGKPLLQWTCEAALASDELETVILSTDDEEMAELGFEWGVEVPFLRPAELAQDDTPTLPVVQHALERLLEDRGEIFSAVCLLQPTNPLRRASDIDDACALFRASEADSVVSVAKVPNHYHPMWTYLIGETGELRQAAGNRIIPRRQELPPAFHRDGSIYITRREVILDQNSLYGAHVVPFHMAPERCGGIDTVQDLEALKRRTQIA